MKICFLLPGDVCSGGVRVTAQMANVLLRRGHQVRIGYRRHKAWSRSDIAARLRTAKYFCTGVRETRWLGTFAGPRQSFLKLSDLRFAEHEVVIAVGNDAIEELRLLPADVDKFQYCHGLTEQTDEEIRHVWGSNLPTITVSRNLAQTLEQSCRPRIVGVVPNGIYPEEYFDESRLRDGIGFIHHGSALKGGDVSQPLLDGLRKQSASLRCRSFGTYPRPRGFVVDEYVRFPSIAEARRMYNRSKIWLITSRDEGFCLPILEAMACGAAVVSSRLRNSADLIEHEINGLLVDYGDVPAYLNAVHRLLTDEALRSRLVANAFATVRRYKWESAGDAMERTLHDALLVNTRASNEEQLGLSGKAQPDHQRSPSTGRMAGGYLQAPRSAR